METQHTPSNVPVRDDGVVDVGGLADIGDVGVEQPIGGASEPKLPVWFVCDCSVSMTHVLPGLSQMLRDLGTKLRDDPLVAQTAVSSVITFSDTASLVLEREHLADATLPPLTLSPQGNTHYDAALALLRQVVETDMTELKAEFDAVYRGLVFFLTDGQPNGPAWEPVWDTFLSPTSDFKYRPNMVPIGWGDVIPATLQRLSNTGLAYHAADDDPDTIVGGIRDIVMHTVVTGVAAVNGVTPATGGGGGAAPAPAGFTALTFDPI